MKASVKIQPTFYEILVLMYHRIDKTNTDPWGICVSPENFEKQIQFLKTNFNVISTDEIIRYLDQGIKLENTACITFDDGYADNYWNAKPVLEKYNCAATFFITTAFINQTKPFWWDELELIFLTATKLPGYLFLQIQGNSYEYTLNRNELTYEQLFQHKHWKWHEEPPTDRCNVFINIWERLRPLSYEEIEMHLNKIREWAAGYINPEQRFPMNEQQLLELSKSKLFTIGLHTHTHPDLLSKEKQIQVEEISSCKKILNRKYGIACNCLAYPYGMYNATTINVVKELHLDACFTTEQTVINITSDKLKLGRYQVFDWDVAAFRRYINSWIYKPALVNK